MSDYHFFGLCSMIFLARAQSTSAAWVLCLMFLAAAVFLKVAA
jgi:hypothetical protein